jgi:hypothetical protein
MRSLATVANQVDQNSDPHDDLNTMAWTVELRESVIEDRRWSGKKTGRQLLNEIEQILVADPLVVSRNLKELRPNPIAQRELRLRGVYRALFNVDRDAESVTVMLVGEKRGNALYRTRHEVSGTP